MKIDVRGPNGNVFVIMGLVSRLLRESGRGNEIERIMADMQFGDYRHALEVATRETYGSLEFVGLEDNQ